MEKRTQKSKSMSKYNGLCMFNVVLKVYRKNNEKILSGEG